MAEISTSRRAFVGTGIVAGAAVLAPLMLKRKALGAGDDSVTVVNGRAVAFKINPAEQSHWQAMVGKPIRLTGSDGAASGVIEAVEPLPVQGKLPAGVRQQPFTVRFAVDKAGAPAGAKT